MRLPERQVFSSSLASLRSSLSIWANLAVFPVVLLFAIPSLVWFGRHWMIFIDSAEYLLLGSNLISGQGYVHLDGNLELGRGPVLPALIGAFIFFLGPDTEILAWGVRLLAVANPLLAYFLLKRISGSTTGLIAAALVSLFSYTATITESFNIDAVLLTMYLLTLLTLLSAVQRKNEGLLALLSGLLLGVAILTKETAFTNLPLAAIAALLLGWTLRGVLWHYLGVVLVCLPWWAWVWSVSREVYLVGSLPGGIRVPAAVTVAILVAVALTLYASGVPARLLGTARRRRQAVWLLSIAWIVVMSGLLLTTSVALADSSLDTVRRFVVDRLAGYTSTWPLLLAAGCFVAWRSTRGSALWQFYAVTLAVQIPVCLLTTIEGWSLRQFLIPQVLLLCALAALVVEICGAAFRGRGAYDRLAAVAAASLVVVLLSFGVTQVRTLLGEPDSWRYFDRTSRVSPDSVRSVSVIRKMHGWTAENVPKGETIVEGVFYSNYLGFLDGGRHEWADMRLDCESGRRNPTTSGCVPSEVIAQAPPKPTAWYWMEEDCTAIALSGTGMLDRMEQAEADYLMISSNPKYPGILGATRYLEESGAFIVAHEEEVDPRTRNGETKGVVLLETTGETPKAAPTRMDASTLNRLVKCEKAQGDEYAESIRSRFPNGITLAYSSARGQSTVEEAERTTKAHKKIEKIYPEE